jgi:hypothetical protein
VYISPYFKNKHFRGDIGEKMVDQTVHGEIQQLLGNGIYDEIHGIDSIFINNDTGRILFVESKFRQIWNANHNVTDSLLGEGYGHVQMSREWLKVIAKQMEQHDHPLAGTVKNALLSEQYDLAVGVTNKNLDFFYYIWDGQNWVFVKNFH